MTRGHAAVVHSASKEWHRRIYGQLELGHHFPFEVTVDAGIGLCLRVEAYRYVLVGSVQLVEYQQWQGPGDKSTIAFVQTAE